MRTLTTHLTLALAALLSQAGTATAAATAPLASAVVRSSAEAPLQAYDALVEAVQQTVVAAQVAGAVVQLDVKAGDRVKAGQLLMRIDARSAEQQAAASDAQVAAARAQLDAARKTLARQQQLQAQNFISSAALDQAEAQFKTVEAQVNAQLAQASAARTQSGLHLVRAPYAGVVAELPVALGDMAMPGRPLLTLYEPAALRVTAAIPQSLAAALEADKTALRIELPGAAAAQRWPLPGPIQLLPTIDPATHTVQLRAGLPAAISGLSPGQFARVWLPGAAGAGRLLVPAAALLRRGELTAVYVIADQGQVLLRQVRAGRRIGDVVEILSGLRSGERVALDPQAAAAQR